MTESLVKQQVVVLSEMERMAEAVAKSGLFGIKTKEQALALMLIAQAEGRHPALAARDYNIIQGKPSKTAEAMLRDFIDCNGKVEWHALNDEIADATFSHPQGGTVRISWDMERASKAGLSGKDNWKKHPRQMLRSRTVSEGVRTVCPSATSGFYVPEEVLDFAEPKNITPIKSVPETNIEYEPEYVDPKTIERAESTLQLAKEHAAIKTTVPIFGKGGYAKEPVEDDTADVIFNELESRKNIARELVERVQKCAPERNLDETVAFLTSNPKATYAAISGIKSPEKLAKLETLITTATQWLRASEMVGNGVAK